MILYGYLSQIDYKKKLLTFTIIGDRLENDFPDNTRDVLRKYIKSDINIKPFKRNEFFVYSNYGIAYDIEKLLSRQVKVIVETRFYTLKSNWNKTKGQYLTGIKLFLTAIEPVTYI